MSYLCRRYEIRLVTILLSAFVVRWFRLRHLNLDVDATSEFKLNNASDRCLTLFVDFGVFVIVLSTSNKSGRTMVRRMSPSSGGPFSGTFPCPTLVSEHTNCQKFLTFFVDASFLLTLFPTTKSGRSACLFATSSSRRRLSSEAAIRAIFSAFSWASAACFAAFAAAAFLASSWTCADVRRF
jgi:hypothetical protein